MRAALVTAATTPLGRAVVQALLESNPAIRVLAVGAEADGGFAAQRVEYRQSDLTRYRRVQELLFGPGKDLGIEAVVHSALHRSARDSGRRVHALNVESTRELLGLAERHPTVRRFVFVSHASVYQVHPARPSLIAEDHPVDFSPYLPQRVRDRVEADMMTCGRMGLSPLRICVLRLSEILAPDVGSQVWDYLRSAVCFRPLGFDPMLNLLSLSDAANALALAVSHDAEGVFNIPGADTLPLSRIIERWGRRQVPVPGPLLAPLYRLRASTLGMDFRYDMNHRRFHFSAVLDGRRAREQLGYQPRYPLLWPAP